MNSRVDIVIPHYGSDDLLTNCIGSFKDDPSVGEMMVVNNNKENLGFSRGVNEGIRDLWDTDSEYIAIVNNDTVAIKNPISPLIDVLNKNDKCAIVSPMIVSMEDNDKIIHAGGTQVFPNGVHKSGSVSLGHHDKITKEKWLSFVVVLLRKKAIVDIGLLDEKMFLIGSDSDWCYRARYAGWDCMYCPDSIWSHKVGESGRATSEESKKIQRSDMFRFYKKWISREGGIFQELDLEVM